MTYFLGIEEWRVIPSFPDYEASSAGRIRRKTPACGTRPGKILRTPPNRGGYLKASLSINGKMRHSLVHILVAEAFIGPRPEGMFVNHKDLIKSNCHKDNLEYMTRAENEEHARINGHKADSFRDVLSKLSPTRILTVNDVLAIRKLKSEGAELREIAVKFGVSVGQICRICRRQAWRWVA